MIPFLAICGHLAFNAVTGGALCALTCHERNWGETLALSFLVGMYAETLLIATLMFVGVSLTAAILVALVALGGMTVLGRGRLQPARVSFGRLRWYEWALLAVVGEQSLFALWQLLRTPVTFDDALTHWSGRARALFGGVNWSWDAASPAFLAGQFGSRQYPLQVVLWRAITAKLSGGWYDALARADGLVFWGVIVGTVWLAVRRFSGIRWLAAAAAFASAAVPLHAWHAAAGYSDIAVEAFVVGSVAALLRGEWLVGGVLAAGAAWSKNDGLVLYFPALLTAAALLSYGRQESARMTWRRVGLFCAGFATLAPWWAFNAVHALGVSPGPTGFGWHPGAPGLLWDRVLLGPTGSILWIGAFAGIAGTCADLLEDATGRALLSVFLIVQGSILFVFCFTDAFIFLKEETTIHRSMMQFSGVAILVAAYGIHLRIAGPKPQA